ncbi:SPX domain-containing protein [Fimicolochytrium jonesii]|uniref:SPX domain-containing protein n=1 Tax=Fimicolochytrium jonesii TaxID=1396493 RepID=UPI0022FEA5C2|nr:SPX domain-containing protein [Fimicolochytrium jonesii]KAI8823688.1 SPX domain-containing protein [Fimicolochytrium jonesii]
MKFAQQLNTAVHQPWANYYVDYKLLKKRLKDLQREHESHEVPPLSVRTPQPSHPAPSDRFTHKELQRAFFQAVENEVDKVEWFYMHRVHHARREMQELMERWFRLSRYAEFDEYPLSATDITHHVDQEKEIFSHFNADLSALLHHLQLLSGNYLAMCRMAIVKILKKHDKLEARHAGLACKEAVVRTIRADRRFWQADDLIRLLDEVKRFKWDVIKAHIRTGAER